MRPTPACVALVLAGVCAAPLLAQDKDKKAPVKAAPKTISLSGCVVRGGEKTPADQFTLEDVNEGKYRLTGINLRDYIGQRVTIAGAVVETSSGRSAITDRAGRYRLRDPAPGQHVLRLPKAQPNLEDSSMLRLQPTAATKVEP